MPAILYAVDWEPSELESIRENLTFVCQVRRNGPEKEHSDKC